MKQNLIYKNAFDKMPNDWTQEVQSDWQMEGKGIADCGDGFLCLRSRMFTVPRSEDGHFNFWLKREFPAEVAFEWEFRYPAPGEMGLAIVMWASRGRNGGDIFAPSLPPRRGEHMEDMHSGAINCYHTSYIARSRKDANLRKNYGFHLLASGPDLSTLTAPDLWHTIRVEQYRDTITLSFNGTVSYSHQDDGSQGGPPFRTGGAFGFRQQNNLYEGHYRNFKVFALV